MANLKEYEGLNNRQLAMVLAVQASEKGIHTEPLTRRAENILKFLER